MTTVEQLADELAVDPGDIRVILAQHDVHDEQLLNHNARDVRLVLDDMGQRSNHLRGTDTYGLGSPNSPTGPADLT